MLKSMNGEAKKRGRFIIIGIFLFCSYCSSRCWFLYYALNQSLRWHGCHDNLGWEQCMLVGGVAWSFVQTQSCNGDGSRKYKTKFPQVPDGLLQLKQNPQHPLFVLTSTLLWSWSMQRSNCVEWMKRCIHTYTCTKEENRPATAFERGESHNNRTNHIVGSSNHHLHVPLSIIACCL